MQINHRQSIHFPFGFFYTLGIVVMTHATPTLHLLVSSSTCKANMSAKRDDIGLNCFLQHDFILPAKWLKIKTNLAQVSLEKWRSSNKLEKSQAILEQKDMPGPSEHSEMEHGKELAQGMSEAGDVPGCSTEPPELERHEEGTILCHV